MKFDLMLTGVGGEGVLTTQVIIARALNLEGYFVRGLQLHGLAQRGGSIPTFIRFGSKEEICSPCPMQGNADLILAFEPLEALRATYYARKEKTVFLINNNPLEPISCNVYNLPYPNLKEIKRKIKPFAKAIYLCNTSKTSKEKFGKSIYGNMILLGIAIRLGLLPLKRESVIKAIEITIPRSMKENIEAFDYGYKGDKYVS